MTQKLIVPAATSQRKSHLSKMVLGVVVFVMVLVSLVIVMLGGETAGQVTNNVKNDTNDFPQPLPALRQDVESPAPSGISEETPPQNTQVYINGSRAVVPESGELTRVIQDSQGTTVIDVTVDSSTSGSVNSSTSSTTIETYSSNESYSQIEEVRN